MPIEVLRARKYKAGYEVRTERLSGPDYGMPEGKSMEMCSAYTPAGDYIGDPRTAHRLVVKRGIQPEKAAPDHNVCSIGFCEKEQKWYGWSHRAIKGFGIGDIAVEGICSRVARTLDDCKRMAIAFADSVR